MEQLCHQCPSRLLEVYFQIGQWSHQSSPMNISRGNYIGVGPSASCCTISGAARNSTPPPPPPTPIVVKTQLPSLIGRNCLLRILVDWKAINVVENKILSTFLNHYQKVFIEELETFKSQKVKTYVDPGVQPCFCKT